MPSYFYPFILSLTFNWLDCSRKNITTYRYNVYCLSLRTVRLSIFPFSRPATKWTKCTLNIAYVRYFLLLLGPIYCIGDSFILALECLTIVLLLFSFLLTKKCQSVFIKEYFHEFYNPLKLKHYIYLVGLYYTWGTGFTGFAFRWQCGHTNIELCETKNFAKPVDLACL